MVKQFRKIKPTFVERRRWVFKFSIMSDFIIRAIRKADNAEVAKIIRTVMTSFGAVGEGFSIEDPEVDQMYEAYQGNQSEMYVVVGKEGKVMGCGGFAPLVGGDSDTCELRKMYFLPEARGKGLGRKMLEMSLVGAKRAGFKKCYLETLVHMKAARRLYEKAGFLPLTCSLGNTGHGSCDSFYLIKL